MPDDHWGDQALRVKTSAPDRRPNSITRRSLIAIARDTGSTIVGVSAPAGYGKSTMLAEWAAAETRPVAWATIDRFDDDPASLLTLLATACSEVSPGAAEVIAEMNGVGTSLLGRSAPLLADALAGTPTPFVLFLDDLHTVRSVACEDALELVLRAVPAGSQAVLASRHELPFLARLRADGIVFELGADELRLDETGARAIFETTGVTVSDHDLRLAVERCEGWPTGLHLCALVVRSDGALTVGGDERFVADYLYRECLASLPADLQRFLRRTSVLEELSAELCDAVLAEDGSAAALRELEARNLFLIPLDRRRRWFRYHGLFREFLAAELERVDGGDVAALHVRAADWFEASGESERAVEHLLAAGEDERASTLVAEIALPIYYRGKVAIVDRWLAHLGEAAIEGHPALAVIAVWTALLLGESPASERRAAILERIDASVVPEADRVVFESARAMLRVAMCAHGPEQALADATFAVANEPEWSPWRDQAHFLLGSALLLSGDPDAARDPFLRATECALESGGSDLLLLSEAELAILAIEQGAWQDAENHVHTALRGIEDYHMDGYSTSALALAVAARTARHRGDASAADRYLARAMRARVLCTHVLPFLAVRVRLQLAKAFAAGGDRASAMHMLGEIDAVLRRRPLLGTLVAEVDGFRAKLRASSGDGVGIVPLTPAELRLLPYLQTHLTIGEIGERLYVSRNTVSSEVGSIYRKLGVTTRGAAVERALAVGLLGG